MAINFYKALLTPLIIICSVLFLRAQQCDVIYVTPGGAGSGIAGTRLNPASLRYGLSLAGGASTTVWMAEGTYNLSDTIGLVNGVTIEGGFDPTTWIKSNATPTIIDRDNTNPLPVVNALACFFGVNISGFRLQDLTIQVDAAAGNSVTTYGLYLNSCSNYNVVRCNITAGAGSAGVDGLPGVAGVTGGDGANGSAYGNEQNVPQGGAGGTGGGGAGGAGAAGGGWQNSYGPVAGAGSCGAAGGNTPHTGPGCGCGLFGTSANTSCSGSSPTDGTAGAAGVTGSTGSAGPAGAVTIPGYYIPGAAAGSGTAGTNGCGGGGGGGGSGRQQNGTDDIGGSGGGGGAGGGGGTGGTGGTGGGGSFAVFLYNNGAGGNITDCLLTAGAGGAGGQGGAGGALGPGGTGGTGGAGFCGPGFSAGADGGDGGAGGAGGPGGQGATGLSAVLEQSGGTTLTQNGTTVPGNPPVIAVQNTGCTNSQILFTAPVAGAWNFGAGATPATGNGTGPIAVNYSSVGRKTVTFSGTTFTDFVDIFNAETVSNTITQSGNPPINGCPDTFHTTIPASLYVWDFGPLADPSIDTGTIDSVFSTVFLEPGTYTVSVYANTACCGIVKDSVTFTVHPNTLNISLTNSPDTICQGSEMTFVASPAGYARYVFLIDDSMIQSNSNDTFNTYALKPGDSVIVLGYQGSCYTNPSATIHPLIYPIPTAPTLTNDIPSDTICGGDTITFTATPGYQNYTFSNGSSAQQYDNPSNVWITDQLGQGNSISVIASQNGCFSRPSNLNVIIVKPTPVVFASDASTNICQGTINTVTANVTPGATYQFFVNGVLVQDSTASSYTTANFNNGDSVYVEATLNGCTSHPSAEAFEGITVRPTPTVTLTSSAQPSDSICQGAPITFTASPPTDTAYLFYNGSSLLQDGPSSTYTTSNLPQNNSIWVSVVNSSDCPSLPSDTISTTVIPDPVVTVGAPPQPVCITAPAQTLTGFAPAGGIWTGAGTTAAGVVTPATAGDGAHELVYTYIDPTTGCPGSDSVLFTVNPLPVIAIVPASPIVCLGQSVQLQASGGTTYVWTPATGLSSAAVSNPIASPTQTTDYELSVTDANNCSDTASVTVTVIPHPTVNFTATTVCANTPTVFTSTANPSTGITYLWNFADGSTSTLPDPTHTYTTADSFEVSVIVQLGTCYDTATNPVIVDPAVIANFTSNTQVSYDDNSDPVIFTNQSTNSSQWTWNFGDNTTSNLESPQHVYTQPGPYTITLLASNQFGCSDSIVKVDYISIYPLPAVFIPNAFTPGVNANNILYVYTTGTVFFEWSIFDRWGEKVYESNNPNEGWDGTYRGKPAPQGVYTYYAKIVFDDGSTRHCEGSATLLR